MIRRQRRRQDVLSLSLKSLPVNEALICTRRTYLAVAERLGTFCSANRQRVYITFVKDSVYTIKRTV